MELEQRTKSEMMETITTEMAAVPNEKSKKTISEFSMKMEILVKSAL